MPTEKPALPTQLWFKEQTWDYWQGSPTDIARIAKRADEWLDKHFTNFSVLPRERWYRPGGRIAQQEAIHQHHAVRTTRWVGGARADQLADEIDARRALVRGVNIESEVIWRAWYQDDIFKTTPMRETPPPDRPPPGVSTSWDVIAPPHKIEVVFDTETPAAYLRVVAPSPMLCRSLFDHMAPHIAAGTREHLWSRERAARVGAVGGLLGGIAISVFVPVSVGLYAGLLMAYVLGSAGDRLVRWASPPLELIEAWEKSRWSQARTYAWQGLLILIALLSILLTIALT